MRIPYLILAVFPLAAFASEKADQFQILEKSINPKTAIAVLLKPYGKVEDFKIFDESVVSENCSSKTVIRANVTCNKKELVKESLYFAEGNGLLCRISDNFKSIRCLPK
jgi:hypothetical protein